LTTKKGESARRNHSTKKKLEKDFRGSMIVQKCVVKVGGFGEIRRAARVGKRLCGDKSKGFCNNRPGGQKAFPTDPRGERKGRVGQNWNPSRGKKTINICKKHLEVNWGGGGWLRRAIGGGTRLSNLEKGGENSSGGGKPKQGGGGATRGEETGRRQKVLTSRGDQKTEESSGVKERALFFMSLGDENVTGRVIEKSAREQGGYNLRVLSKKKTGQAARGGKTKDTVEKKMPSVESTKVI